MGEVGDENFLEKEQGETMTSNRQSHSNELNTEQIAGPRSLQHKKSLPRDFRKNRMPSKYLVITGEDPAHVDALVADFDKRFRPSNVFEDSLVQHMMRNEWRCRRTNRVAACLLRDRTQDHSAKLAVLTRYKASLRRSFRQCLRLLSDFRVTEVRAPHLIDGGIPTATIIPRRASKKAASKSPRLTRPANI